MLTCMAALGALLYDTGSIETVFKSGYSIFGFLVGATLIYILKGLNTWGIINIAKNYVLYGLIIHSSLYHQMKIDSTIKVILEC